MVALSPYAAAKRPEVVLPGLRALPGLETVRLAALTSSARQHKTMYSGVIAIFAGNGGGRNRPCTRRFAIADFVYVSDVTAALMAADAGISGRCSTSARDRRDAPGADRGGSSRVLEVSGRFTARRARHPPFAGGRSAGAGYRQTR